MISGKGESLKPESGNLIQHCTFEWNRIWQDDIESGEPVGSDKEQVLPEIENLAHLPAAQFRDSGQVDR